MISYSLQKLAGLHQAYSTTHPFFFELCQISLCREKKYMTDLINLLLRLQRVTSSKINLLSKETF